MSDKPEALFLADELEAPLGTVISGEVDRRAAIELRRLHAEVERLSNICYDQIGQITALRAAKQMQRRIDALKERTLTDEGIADLWHQNGGFHHHFARAVERWLKGEE
jgi:hypothetical protein